MSKIFVIVFQNNEDESIAQGCRADIHADGSKL